MEPLSPLDCGEIIKTFQEALTLIQEGVSEHHSRHWIEELTPSHIEKLEGLLRSGKLTVAERLKFQNVVSILHFIHHRMKQCMKTGAGVQEQVKVKWNEIESAFENRMRTGAITNLQHVDLTAFLEDARTEFEHQINDSLDEHNSLKVFGVLAAEFIMKKADGDIKEIKYFNTEAKEIYLTTSLPEWYLEHIQKRILRDVEEFQEKDSGWSLHSIINLTLNINKLNPMRGSSWIPLPPFIENKHACINVDNKDNECFKWAILSALYPVKKNGQRTSKYENDKDILNFGKLEFPMLPRDIPKFEKLNPGLSINLYMLEKKSEDGFKVFPCYLTPSKQEKHVNLLFLEDRYYAEDEFVQEESKNFHYVWIKNMSALISSQVTINNHKKFLCDRCFHYFYSQASLDNHTVDCIKINKCTLTLPDEHSNKLKFNNHKYHERSPFVIYADMECLLKPLDDDDDQAKQAFQEHEPFSISYYLKCSFDDSLSSFNIYRRQSEEEEKPARWFVNNLLRHAQELEKLYENPKPMNELTSKEKAEYARAKTCYICGEHFTKRRFKVRDHDHFTGR